MSDLNEDDFRLMIQVHPSGTRDFVFYTIADGEAPTPRIIQPMNLLGLDLAASVLELYRRQEPEMSVVISLCRLLVPCLEYRGNRRHLIAEVWSESDLRGETLYEHTRIPLSRDLAVNQAGDFRVVTTGVEPPQDSLAEIFWEAHSSLRDLPDVFEDPDMSNLVRVLYDDLVQAGTGRQEVRISNIRRRIMSHWSENFGSLDLRVPTRQRRRVFKDVLAATIRLASQFNGVVARALIFRRLDSPRDEQTFTPEEEALLELRYGGSRALRDINIGLLFGCGPLFAELVNDFAFAHVAGVPEADLETQTERLHQYIDLLGRFRQRRRRARAEEQRERRSRRPRRPPTGRRVSPANREDEDATNPGEQAIFNEDWDIMGAILPLLKPRDAERLQAMMDARGDYRRAAEIAGVDPTKFHRRWRQTTLQNIREKIEDIAASEGLGSLLNERHEDGEEETES